MGNSRAARNGSVERGQYPPHAAEDAAFHILSHPTAIVSLFLLGIPLRARDGALATAA